MRFVRMDQVIPGMRLGMEVKDLKEKVILRRGEPLDQYQVGVLRLLGYYGVYIEDVASREVEMDPVIPMDERFRLASLVKIGKVEDICYEGELLAARMLQTGPRILNLINHSAFEDYLFFHAVNVAIISVMIGIQMEMPIYRLVTLANAALLMDMGMQSIPIPLQNKANGLTNDEFLVLKGHVQKSYDAIKKRKDVSDAVKDAVYCHHENLDGSGYPRGLAGEELSIYAKILRVADVYDALISYRPFKSPYSSMEAREYLMGGCGIMFDYKVVTAALEVLPIFPVAGEVILSDGNQGVVLDNTGSRRERPRVRLSSGFTIDLYNPLNDEVYVQPLLQQSDEQLLIGEARASGIAHAKKNFRVMVVDDLRTNLESMREILGDFYELTLLKSGRQALSFLENNPCPDMILMDIDMPEMDGLETTREINKQTGGLVPIMFVSSHCDRETVVACHMLKAAGYVARPYNAVFIRSEIKRILNGHVE